MKRKKGCYFILILGTIMITSVFTIEPIAITLGNSISLLLRKGYFIPEESKIYRFIETKSDQGSSEYWLYGEDDNFYFYTGKCDIYQYGYIKREDAHTNPNFNKHDYTTWQYCHLPE